MAALSGALTSSCKQTHHMYYASPHQKSTYHPTSSPSLKEKKLQKDSEVSGPASDTENDSPADWSEVEEGLSFPIVQPTDGWKTAERRLPSVVQGAAGEKSRSVYSTYEIMEEHGTRTAGSCETGKDCCFVFPKHNQILPTEFLCWKRVVLEAGHQVVFCPGFHCKLDYRVILGQ